MLAPVDLLLRFTTIGCVGQTAATRHRSGGGKWGKSSSRGSRGQPELDAAECTGTTDQKRGGTGTGTTACGKFLPGIVFWSGILLFVVRDYCFLGIVFCQGVTCSRNYLCCRGLPLLSGITCCQGLLLSGPTTYSSLSSVCTFPFLLPQVERDEEMQEELLVLSDRNEVLKRKREGVRDMFGRSQKLLKKTLDECMALQQKLVAMKEEQGKRGKKGKGNVVKVVVAEEVKEGEEVVEQERRREKNKKERVVVTSGKGETSSPRKSRETRTTLLRHISGMKGALENFLQASTCSA